MSAHENDSEMAEAVKDLDKMDTTAKSGLPTLTVTPATDVYSSTTSVITVDDQIPSNSTAKFVEKKGEPKIARQILGTSMGTKLAPSYANIFLGKLEDTPVAKYFS